MSRIPDDVELDGIENEPREFLFWLDDTRAIAIRAVDEDTAREQLASSEERKVVRVTIAGVDLPNEQDRQLLAQLGNRPEWQSLRRLADTRMREHFRRLARHFATRNAEPDYADLQWQRGFFAGMKFLLDNPTMEARKLSRALREERTD